MTVRRELALKPGGSGWARRLDMQDQAATKSAVPQTDQASQVSTGDTSLTGSFLGNSALLRGHHCIALICVTNQSFDVRGSVARSSRRREWMALCSSPKESERPPSMVAHRDRALSGYFSSCGRSMCFTDAELYSLANVSFRPPADVQGSRAQKMRDSPLRAFRCLSTQARNNGRVSQMVF